MPAVLQTIADRLGVHKSTVSRALRGDPRVNEFTAEKIRAIAEELDYRPNPIASALSEARWLEQAENKPRLVSLAFLSNAESDNDLANDSEFELMAGAAEERGYKLLAVAVKGNMRARHVNRRLRAMGVRGVLIGRITDQAVADDFEWHGLAWDDFVWVSAGEDRFRSPTHRVLYNAFSGTRLALASMADKGYQRIAFIRSLSSRSPTVIRQRAGFLITQAERTDLELADFPCVDENPDAAAIEDFQPEALLTSIASLRDGLPSSLLSLPWATLGLQLEELGLVAGTASFPLDRCRAAVEMVDLQHRRGSYGLPLQRHTLMIDPLWKEGDSLPEKVDA